MSAAAKYCQHLVLAHLVLALPAFKSEWQCHYADCQDAKLTSSSCHNRGCTAACAASHTSLQVNHNNLVFRGCHVPTWRPKKPGCIRMRSLLLATQVGA